MVKTSVEGNNDLVTTSSSLKLEGNKETLENEPNNLKQLENKFDAQM